MVLGSGTTGVATGAAMLIADPPPAGIRLVSAPKVLTTGFAESISIWTNTSKKPGASVGSSVPVLSRMANENWSGVPPLSILVPRERRKERALPGVKLWMNWLKKLLSVRVTPDVRFRWRHR